MMLFGGAGIVEGIALHYPFHELRLLAPHGDMSYGMVL